jgi:pimeloyl-ACP methyl ester carboxylesterase
VSAVRTRDLNALGLHTRVLEAGAGGDEEAVVFLHGSPGSANHWDDLLPRVGAFARAVALDLPGFGEADRPADWDYSPSSYATFIAGALSELGIRRAHLVMHDIGGVGVVWAAAHPEAFAGAVLIDTGVLIGYSWHLVARLHRMPVAGALVARGARLGLRPVMRFFDRAPRRLAGDVIERWSREYDWGTRRAMLRFYRSTPASAFERLAPSLRQLDRPALVLWGAHDPFVPVEQAERQRESFPSAEVVVLEDSGHYVHLDDPGGTAQVVVPFLRRQFEEARAA